MLRYLLLVTSFLVSTAGFAQEERDSIQLDYWYRVDELRIFQDSTRNLNFDAIREQVFSPVASITPNLEATIWRRFKVPYSAISDTLCIRSYSTSNGILYVPKKKGYEKIGLGLQMHVPHNVATYQEKYLAYLQNIEIDHDRFFYLREEVKGHWVPNLQGENVFFGYIRSRISLVNALYRFSEFNHEYHFYVGVICMSFLLFFIRYSINRNVSFLVYSLYLLALVVYYGNRLVPTFNLYNTTIPEFFFYVNQIGRFAILFTYYYFIYVFLDVPERFQKVDRYARYSLISIAVFSTVYTLITILYPLLPGRHAIVNTFYILAAINGLILIVWMLFSKPNTIAIITLLGTLLINMGSLLSIYVGNAIILLKMVLVETVVFFGIISYQNKIKEKAAAENLLALDVEKREKESLKELDLLKSKLFANISHEFKTPLTLIKTPLEEAIRRRQPLEGEDFSLIYKNTDRLANLIDNLLSLSKLESNTIRLQLKRGNPMLQLRDICSQFKSYGQSKGVAFIFEREDKGLTASYDHEILETCVNNVLSNAMKFTDKGGQVRLKATILEGSLHVTVSDSGMGIKAEDLDKIFDRFYQVSEKDESRPGSGIGLSIVKELLHLHKGTITVQSTPGEGSTFSLTLPLDAIQYGTPSEQKKDVVATPKAMVATPAYQIEFAVQNKRRILIVEDNVDLLQFLTRKLENKYDVKTSKNGKLGVETALSWLPDVILSDVMMPVMDGIALCKTLKMNMATAHIPVILLTAKSAQKDELIGLGTGADAYITKPFTLEKLELVIEQRIALRKVLLHRYQKNMLFEADAENITTAEQDFLHRLQRTLQNKLTDPMFNTAQMAEAMGLSRMQLNRKMKRIIQKTPSGLIRNERLTLATTLLKDSKLSIKEVAYQSGFNSPSYFIKVFKERFKVTPSDYLHPDRS
ncbi:MAG: ATP-binding protein [Bacteroidota bacterium]